MEVILAPIPTFSSAEQNYTIYHTISLDEGETLFNVTSRSSANWIYIESTQPYESDILLYSNNTTATRTGTITLTITTNNGTYEEVISIEQTAFEVFPVWADKIIQYETQSESVDYYIVDYDTNETIYNGKAFAFPNRNYVEINISNICSNYLTSTMEGLIDNGEDWKEQGGVKLFYLYINESLYGTYLFYNSYGYKQLPMFSYLSQNYISLSEPIRKIYDSRQYVPHTFFNALLPSTQKYTNTIAFLRLRPTVRIETVSGELKGRTMYTFFVKPMGGMQSVKFFNLPNIDIDEFGCSKYCLYYLNAYGGWDSFLINGNDKETDTITSYKYMKNADNTKKQFALNNYLNVISKKYSLKTDWLNDDEASRMYHLLESTEVWMHNLETDEITPVIITNKTCEYKTFKNNGRKKFYYTIDVEASKEQIRK